MENVLPSDAQEQTLGVAFFDLARFGAWARGREDRHVAAFIQSFYECAWSGLEPTGARLIKFMGDAGLASFAPERAGEVVAALRTLRGWVQDHDADDVASMDLVAKLHVGRVVSGTFGAGGARHFDVMGPAVCDAARLPGPGLVLSPAAARHLPAGERATFEVDEGAVRER